MTPAPPPAPPPGAAVIMRVFAPFALGYFLSYVYRTVNAVIGPELARELGLGAESLGLLTGAYFLTFAAFQLPLGVLLDRFGPRRVEAALLVVAALGAAAFAVAQSLATLTIARGLIGLGVSACLMAGFKAFVVWLPKDRLPLANGALLAFGATGALAATAPAEAALDAIGWRGLFAGLAGATVIAAAVLLVVVPERPRVGAPERFADQLAGMGAIARSRLFWRYAPLLGTLHGGFLALQSLWAGPWLRDVAGLERAEVADVLLLAAAAMIASALGIGWAATRLTRLGIALPTIVAVGSAALLVVEVCLVFGIGAGTPWLPWTAFGLCGGFPALMFPAVTHGFPTAMAGRVVTSLNLFLFAGAFLLQYAIGWVIDLFPASVAGGYDPRSYTAALGALWLLQASAFAWFLAGGRRAS